MQHIHLIGIGGTGLSAIARVLLESGYTVSGSDRAASPYSRDLAADGVRVSIGHRAENVAGADLVVRSSAVPDGNEEVIAARALGIPVLKRAEFLGQLTAGKITVAVAGTHGKTSTSAMTAWTLAACGKDPSYIIGSVVKNLGANAHAGKGDAFVIEADEYDRMFLGLEPDILVITYVEHDHPDCFPTPQDYEAAFVEFTGRLKPGGLIIGCGDDPGAARVLDTARRSGKSVLSYGFSTTNDLQAVDLESNELGGFSAVITRDSGEKFASLHLQVPGRHNILNALAALAAAEQLGISPILAANALDGYQGSGRRFEVRGSAAGITYVDDYAHHPTEIRATLAAARARFPGRRIWAVWQPHTYSRINSLYSEFASAFQDASAVIVTEIFAARESQQEFSIGNLVAAMRHPYARYIPALPDVVDFLATHLESGDVVLVLSAGDADQINTKLLEQQAREADRG